MASSKANWSLAGAIGLGTGLAAAFAIQQFPMRLIVGGASAVVVTVVVALLTARKSE